MNCFALDTISKNWVELKLSKTQRRQNNRTRRDTHRHTFRIRFDRKWHSCADVGSMTIYHKKEYMTCIKVLFNAFLVSSKAVVAFIAH